MKNANGFLAVRILVALSAVLIGILWAVGQYAGGDERQALGAEGLWTEPQGSKLLAPSGFRDYLVVWQGASNIWLGGIAGTSESVVALAAGHTHGVALHADGTLTRIGVAPGTSEVTARMFAVTDVSLAVAGGLGDTVALRSGGAVWWASAEGEFDECAGVGNAVALAAGAGFFVALREDQTVTAWGTDTDVEDGVPSWQGPVAEVAAGASFGVARGSDGSVAAWGDDRVATNGLSDVVAVSASEQGAHCLALTSGGTVVAWGENGEGQCDVPEGLSDVCAIAAGGYHSLALRRDGTVVCWGGGLQVPQGLANAVAIDASYLDACAVTLDGKAVVWGAGYPPGGIWIAAKTPGFCAVLEARVLDASVCMAVVRAPDGLLENDGDGDGLRGLEEVYCHGTDPTQKDTDSDGLPDGWEVANGFDPGVWQTDGRHGPADDLDSDGLSNSDEAGRGTDPADADTDNDTVGDGQEVFARVVEWGTPYSGTNAVARPGFLGDVVAVSAGQTHSMALRRDGTVVCWGNNSYGQCVPPTGLSNVVAVAAGTSHSVALLRNATVVCWGYNNFGQCAPPVGLSNVVSVAAGANHSLAVLSNTKVVCWGQNTYRQCTQPAALSNVVAVAGGNYHSMALLSNSNVVCWGYNNYGQVSVPATLKGVVAVAAGLNHCAALRADGTVACWGMATSGQCGVPSGLARVGAIAAGMSHTLAYTSDGRIVAWGLNAQGQARSFKPYGPVVMFDGGLTYSLALIAGVTDPLHADTDGDGMSDGWELANGPDLLNAAEDPDGDGLTNLDECNNNSRALVADTDGDGLKDGDEVSVYGTLPANPDTDGDGFDDAEELFGRVVEWGQAYTGTGAIPRPAHLGVVTAVAAGQGHRLALRADGSVVCWGNNGSGQCTPSSGATNLVAVSAGYAHSAALRADGKVVCWGSTSDNRCAPPADLTNAVSVSAGGAHSLALRRNGTVSAWGANPSAECSVLANLTNAVAVAAGYGYSVALCQDGSVVCWGRTNVSQCAVPAGLTNATAVAAGDSHTVALKKEGTVVCWGYNGYKQCDVPGGLTNVVSVGAGAYHTFAYLADGRIVCWGMHGDGQVIARHSYSPVQWVDGGCAFTVALLKGGSDPNASDSDGDGLSDGDELLVYGLDPSKRDTDGDGLKDRDELANGLDPANPDMDGDSLNDGDELAQGLDPLKPDMDGDELRDGEEVHVFHTDPFDTDSDGDGLDDAAETSARVIEWGQSYTGAGAIARPALLGNVTSVAAGFHQRAAVRADGSVVCWGSNADNVCSPPAGATNLVAVAAGDAHIVALRADGAVVCWGNTSDNRCAPSAYPMDAVSVAAGNAHSLAARRNGTVSAWGLNSYGQCRVPTNLTSAVSVAAGYYHSVALRRDGGVVCWGNNYDGQCTVPAGLTNVAAVAAGHIHTVALKKDGGVVCWGNNGYGQCAVPSGLSNVVAIGAGIYHTLAYTGDGRVVAWGYSNKGQAATFKPYAPGTAVDGGYEFSLALLRGVTDPNRGDSDNDGLSDGAEVLTYKLDPIDPDMDGDGLLDGAEISRGANPLVKDTDGDGLDDGVEVDHGLDPRVAVLDPDGDGLTNAQERERGADPLNPDTDGDGMKDGWEVTYGFNPLSGMKGSLVGWWQFREGGGTNSIDLSGHGNNAYIVCTNHVSWVTDTSLGSALHFDAGANGAAIGYNGGYVGVPGLSNAPVASGFSMAAWVRADSYPSFPAVLTKASDHDARSDGMSLFYQDNGPLAFYAGAWNSGANFVARPDGMPLYAQYSGSQMLYAEMWMGRSGTNFIVGKIGITGAWVHVCGVYDGAKASVYVNGQLCGMNTNVSGSVANADPLWIGSVFNQHQWLWDGDIADVRFYTSPLSANDIFGLIENRADSDNDGLSNAAESLYGTSPFKRDSDGDGLNDVVEVGLRTNPLAQDTDGDGMGDAWEVTHGFDPCARQADGVRGPSDDPDDDGLQNSVECMVHTSPWLRDTDGDRMSDSWENKNGFNPCAVQTDGTRGREDDPDRDGLCNENESAYGTNPWKRDTDGDWLDDNIEIVLRTLIGFDPLNSADGLADGDHDGLPFGWEFRYRLNPYDSADGGGDADGDGLSNLAEFKAGTDPRDADTDDDGMPDCWELTNGLNPAVNDSGADADWDGLSNGNEWSFQTDPHNGDSDGDWLSDSDEVNYRHTNPNSSNTDGDGFPDYFEYRMGQNPLIIDPDGDQDGMADTWETRWFGSLQKTRDSDADGDGFPNAVEFCMANSNPAFAASAMTSSRGRHRFSWTPIAGAASYQVKVLTNGVIARSFTTNTCSLAVTGNFAAAQSVLEVSAFDPAAAATRIAKTSFRQPALPNLTVWKIADPFEVVPVALPENGSLVMEKTFRISQDPAWPQQFFVSSSDDGAGSGYLYLNNMRLQTLDDKGRSCELRYVTGNTPIPVAADAQTLTVRLVWDTSYPAMSYMGLNIARTAVLSNPAYLIAWAPSVSFAAGTQLIENEDGRKILVSVDAEGSQPQQELTFSVNYGGFPYGMSILPMGESALYSKPFGAMLPYGLPPSYTTTSGSGLVTGGTLPLGPYGVYQIGVASAGGGGSGDCGGVPRFDLYRIGLDIDKTYVKNRDDKRDVLRGALGDYPLDTPCLYNAMRHAQEGEVDIDAGLVETGFTVSLNGGVQDDLIDVAPGSSYVWKGGERSKTVILSAAGTELRRENVIRGTTAGAGDTGSSGGGSAGNPWDPPCETCERVCESGDCDTVEGSQLKSVRFRIPLGNTGYKTLAGMVWFNVESNGFEVTPAIFSVMTNSTVETEFYPSGGPSSAVCHAPGGRQVTIVSTNDGVVVSVYNVVDGPADHVWVITNEESRRDKIRFCKYAGEVLQKNEVYEYSDGGWTLTDGFTGARASSLHEGGLETEGWESVTRIQLDRPGGAVLAGSVSRREMIGAGAVAVARETLRLAWDGAAEAWRETRMSYWEANDNGELNGCPKFRNSPHDGSWEYRTYDDYGRETLRAEPLNGSAAPACVSSALPATIADFTGQAGVTASVTVTGYEQAEYEFHLDVNKPRKVERFVVADSAVAATKVSCEWHTYAREVASGYAVLKHCVIRAATQDAGKDDAANGWTETVSYADDDDGRQPLAPLLLRGRPLREERKEGGGSTLTTWSYTYADANGDGKDDSLQIATRHGTPELPNGVAFKSTYEVETLDALFGRTLRRETRLYTGGAEDPVLAWETCGYDGKGRLLWTSFSDGTVETSEWDCCRLGATVGRDGARREFAAVPGNDHWSAVADVSLGSLPGADGSYPVTETLTDALGRETNSVRVVWSAVSRDPAYAPLVTRTEYPFGTDHYRVTVDPLGIATVSRRFFENGAEIEESASAGIISRVTRVQGGATVSEKFWSDPVSGTPAWTRETRQTEWGADGCRVETVSSEASDKPDPVVTSKTQYDFQGRVRVSANPPLSVSTNFYGPAGRLARVTRSGSPDTLYVYDALGNVTETALDADGDGGVTYAGSDRITRTDTVYQKSGADWWRVTSSEVWSREGINLPVRVSTSRVRMTGLGGAAPEPVSPNAVLTAQSETLDARGNVTRISTYTDASAASVWQVTHTPESDQDAVQISVNGHPTSVLSSSSVTETYAYDGFARQTLSETLSGAGDRRVALTTHYNALGQVDYTEDAASNRSLYAYDALGRRVALTDALANTVHTAYDAEGRAVAVWGATYPVAYEYDTAGRMTAMATTRDPALASMNLLSLLPAGVSLTAYSQQLAASLDVTLWLYDHATGLLTKKVYANGTGPSYAYTSSGRLAARVWARGVTASYAYDAFGQLAAVDYSDDTPDVAYTYDRLGRQTSAITSVSANHFTYDGFDLFQETQNDTIIQRWRDGVGRISFTELVSLDTWEWRYGYCHGYDTAGRLCQFDSYSIYDAAYFQYGYLPGSDLLAGLTGTAGSGWTRTYEPNRDLVAGVRNLWGGSPVSAYTYENDALGRRTARTDFDGSVYTANAFGYNHRSEVTEAHMGTHAYGYDYDPIGNRIRAATSTGQSAEAVTEYAANAVNQYSAITSVPDSGQPENPSYDADGNMTACGGQTYVWDAENRLVQVSNPGCRVAFAYDHQSRRIRKEVYAFDAGTSTYVLRSDHRFTYDGWNPVAEAVSSTGSQSPTSYYYAWGLDLSGSAQGAGGVGGLLAVHATGPGPQEYLTCFPACDGNGNVTAYLDPSGLPAAVFTYDAFGNTLSETVRHGLHLPFRFSTKYLDAETGLYYYGYRYYNPSLGRWPSRDPLGEREEVSLYVFVKNTPMVAVDLFGLWGETEHTTITAGAFGAAVPGIGTSTCGQQMLKTIIENNISQDNYVLFWGKIWDRRRHYLWEQGTTLESATRGYAQYIREERSAFGNKLAGEFVDRNNCQNALETLGRLSHSLEDFFGHAVNRASQDNMWWAWTSAPPVTGTPDNPGGLSLSKYGLPNPEHPITREGIEPQEILQTWTEQRAIEWQRRYNSASAYMTEQFKIMLPKWLEKCSCHCSPL